MEKSSVRSKKRKYMGKDTDHFVVVNVNGVAYRDEQTDRARRALIIFIYDKWSYQVNVSKRRRQSQHCIFI